MERIVIYSSKGQEDRGLEEVLKALFPECEICLIRVPEPESGRPLDGCPSGSGTETTRKKSNR